MKFGALQETDTKLYLIIIKFRF